MNTLFSSNKKINPLVLDCLCGCKAELKSRNKKFGYCSSGFEFWVEGSCGMRGKSVDTYELSIDDAQAKCVYLWNEHNGISVKDV